MTFKSGRTNLQVTVVNHGVHAEEIGFYSYFPASAKIYSFWMNQNDQIFHGKKVSHKKAHEIVKQAANENSNAGFYIPQILTGETNSNNGYANDCMEMCLAIAILSSVRTEHSKKNKKITK